ncbi:MAG: YfbM family protein [Desertifilum sp.]|nr:DUF1877 family protein [Oscillatoria laete-virens]MCD8489772.1 YfbM family protein [Desertifilum sp.]MDI9641734.1 DUF1877 family protein [Geitlerinema splendidum]MDL5052149.1 DUF1877 family protein [Oscillatoria laete-virens NRMC-F 0139]
MGIEAELKQISIHTLERLRQDICLFDHFFEAKWLPKSPAWSNSQASGEFYEKIKQRTRKRFDRLSLSQTIQRSVKRVFKLREVVDYDWKALEQQFLQEWEVPELDLHKHFQQLTFLLAGYIPAYYASGWLLPELEVYSNQLNKDFLSFLVVENSEWDNRPLVNAIGAGAELKYKTGYGPVRYLLPNEIEQILNGLLQITEDGFQERYRQESKKAVPCPWIDWSDEEMLEYLTDYYTEIVDYYQDAVVNQRAMLLYLT